VNHCPATGSQSQVTPVDQRTTGLTVSMGKIRHRLLSTEAGLCLLSTYLKIMTIVTLFNKNDNRKKSFLQQVIDFQRQTILTSLFWSIRVPVHT